jgi:thiol:disulfide interchange protein DsbD
VEWDLPPEFRAGTLRYPAPERLIVAGITTHVHRGHAVFAAELTPPATLPQGGAPIGATVRYGVCRDVCYPGLAELRIRLPVAPAGSIPSPNPAWPATAARLAAFPAPGGLTASYRVRGDTADVTLRSERGCLRGEVTFFPSQRDIAPAAASGRVSRAGCVSALVRLPLVAALNGPLAGVVVVGEGAAARAYEVVAR